MTRSLQPVAHPRIWQLYLVPPTAWGRIISGAMLFVVLLAVFYLSGALAPGSQPDNWPPALFFCVIIAYIVPVFHYIIARTQRLLGELAPKLGLDMQDYESKREAIARKPISWQLLNSLSGVVLWMVQSWLLFGAVNITAILSGPAELSIAIGSLPVWLLANQAVHALIDNAVLFRGLAKRADVDLLDTRALHPFGDMAISSTLMIIGAMASMSLLWVNGETNPWTTIPGLTGMTLALFFLFCLPIWPIRTAISAAKRAEAVRIQRRIYEHAKAPPEQLAPLLTYRREVGLISEWPFDTTSLARFGIYLFLVPMTWVGAALIEILVDSVLAG